LDKVCKALGLTFEHNAPVETDLSANIRIYRVAILGEWRDRFSTSLEDSGLTEIKVPSDLLPALFEEILDLLEGGGGDPIPCHHRLPMVGALADFPANISVCLKLLNAGEATLKAFLLGRIEAFGMKSEFDRECIMWDLNKATHKLIHREIQGICEQSLRPIAEICGRIEGHGDTRRQGIPAYDAINFQT
jgi:hypothetical protein